MINFLLDAMLIGIVLAAIGIVVATGYVVFGGPLSNDELIDALRDEERR